ncbi:MAG: hypothetical protein M3Y27_00170 [Acidobacteriota bacterium]|nr:hypothetical protein [Acidobacteriota bacterium]
MRAAFGKVNTLHNHVLPWTDRPLVTQNLVGGEDGINDAGMALSRIFAGPKQIVLEGTAQIFRGDSDDLFHSYRRSDVSTVEHLRGYRDLSESTNLDLGLSYSRGHSAIGPDVVNQLYGIDATVRWKPLRRAIYHSFLSRNEFIWSRIQNARVDGDSVRLLCFQRLPVRATLVRRRPLRPFRTLQPSWDTARDAERFVAWAAQPQPSASGYGRIARTNVLA